MTKQAKVLTNEELSNLLAQAPNDNYRLLWVLQRQTAARISEALQLRWADVNEHTVTFRGSTTKSGETRVVPTSDTLKAALRGTQRGLDEEYIFPTQNSKTQPRSRQAAAKALKLAAAKAGLVGVSCHSFRRTAATRMCRDHGLDLAQKLTGHKSLNELSKYLEPTDEELLAALNAA